MTVATLAIYPLADIAQVASLSVVYLPAVLLIATYWGLGLGVVTALLAAAAFNFFHLPPVGQFTIADSRNWVALVAFVLVALAAGTIAELARGRAQEAERRRAEADLAAALARELLLGNDTAAALASAARRVAEALGLRSAAIELGAHAGDDRRLALPLTGGDGRDGGHAAGPRGPARPPIANGSMRRSCRLCRRWWRSPCGVMRCRPRRSRRPRCGAAMTSRRRCCGPSRMTCAPR